MSVQNLKVLLRSGSAAVIGASDREGSLGAVVLRSHQLGGFSGDIWPVYHRVGGKPAWPECQFCPR